MREPLHLRSGSAATRRSSPHHRPTRRSKETVDRAMREAGLDVPTTYRVVKVWYERPGAGDRSIRQRRTFVNFHSYGTKAAADTAADKLTERASAGEFIPGVGVGGER